MPSLTFPPHSTLPFEPIGWESDLVRVDDLWGIDDDTFASLPRAMLRCCEHSRLTRLHSTTQAKNIATSVAATIRFDEFDNPEALLAKVWITLQNATPSWHVDGVRSLNSKIVEFNVLSPEGTIHKMASPASSSSSEIIRMYLHCDDDSGQVVPYVPRRKWRLFANEIWLNASREEASHRTVTEVICSSLGCIFIATYGSRVHQKSVSAAGRHVFVPSIEDVDTAVDAMKDLPNQNKRVFATSSGVSAAEKSFGRENVVKLVHPSEYIRGAKGKRQALQTCRLLGILKPNIVMEAIDEANAARWLRAGTAGGSVTAKRVAKIKEHPESEEYKQCMKTRACAGRAGGAVTGAKTTSKHHDHEKMIKMWRATEKKKHEDPKQAYVDRATGGWNRTKAQRAKL